MNRIIKFLDLSYTRLSSVLTLTLFLFIFFYPLSLYAQECIGSFTLTSQIEVDDFNCDIVTGSVHIREGDQSNITNLNGLSELTSVGGYLSIYGTEALTNVDGLAALTSVGGDLDIERNGALIRCCGLFPLFTVGTIGGDTIIENNLAGCNSVEDIVNAGPCERVPNLDSTPACLIEISSD